MRGILETGEREKLKDHIKKKIESLKEDIKTYLHYDSSGYHWRYLDAEFPLYEAKLLHRGQ